MAFQGGKIFQAQLSNRETKRDNSRGGTFMWEQVKRNNGGRLCGQLWGVDPNLIEATKKLAMGEKPSNDDSQGWGQKSPKNIAKTIVNGIPVVDLALAQGVSSSRKVISMFTIPGGSLISIPIIVEKENGQPKLFLDTESRIKIH